jgi:hypothetical protein
VTWPRSNSLGLEYRDAKRALPQPRTDQLWGAEPLLLRAGLHPFDRPALGTFQTHSSGGKKTGAEIEMHPIMRSLSVRTQGLLAKRVSRSLSSRSLPTPFASPNTSHTRHSGRRAKRAKRPKPPIASCGALSLKKKGSPAVTARKFVPPGAGDVGGRERVADKLRRARDWIAGDY